MKQSIPKRYIAIDDLEDLLVSLFGADEYEIEERREAYVLTIPEELSDPAQRETLEIPGIYQIPNMLTLREALQDARIPNFEAKLFIPQSAVRRIMTPNRVKEQICKSDIPRQYADDIVKKIMSGGRNVFSILVLIKEEASIRRFIEEDNLQGLEIDRGLPFEGLSLRKRLKSNESINDFEITQWQLSVPHFTGDILPRNLADEVVLPIIRNEPSGEGSFGNVYKIEIEGSHQLIGGISCQFVRKEFRTSTTDVSVQKELFNLCMLRLLKHRCLVEILGSYVQLGKWNLLFRHASEGSLEDCFKRERTKFFQDSQKLLYALYGLTSALSAVHNYFSQPHKLRAIGCHHDLKPGNILVEKETFLLADFGLSKLDIDAKGSSTIPKAVRGPHVAPECKGLGRRVDQGISGTTVVHRSSDIWSLGCIIAEVFTYMIEGLDGLKAFEESRQNKIGSITHARFYHGSGEPHPKVEEWFVKMEGCLNPEEIAILPLIRQMLAIEPTRRPSVDTVLNHMRHISLQSICLKIEGMMESLQHHHLSIELYIERRRFLGWKMSCNLDSPYESGTETPHPVNSLSLCFETIWTTLMDIRELIKEMESGTTPVLGVHCASLKQLNDRLLADLPAEIRKRAHPYLISSILREADQDVLDALATSSDSASGPAAVQVALQRLSARVLDGALPKRPDLRIDPSHIRDRQSCGGFELGRLTDTLDRTLFDVLIEKKRLPYDLSSEASTVELIIRLDAVTEVLEKAASNGFRMLRCCGYFIDSSGAASERGLLYKQPTFNGCSEKLEAATLNSVIFKCRQTKMPTAFPTLDAKFRLARSLAKSVLDFHQAEWLQEDISSHSVLFFYPQGSTWLQNEDTQQPYFVGFLNSRQATLSALTEGPNQKPHREYSHPDYATGVEERFKPSFDYYSLGIVLLEIGRWKTLSAMVDMHKVRNGLQEVRKKLLERELVHLKISMGTIYHDAVALCLSGELGRYDTGDIGQVTMKFAEVVEALSKCVV